MSSEITSSWVRSAAFRRTREPNRRTATIAFGHALILSDNPRSAAQPRTSSAMRFRAAVIICLLVVELSLWFSGGLHFMNTPTSTAARFEHVGGFPTPRSQVGRSSTGRAADRASRSTRNATAARVRQVSRKPDDPKLGPPQRGERGPTSIDRSVPRKSTSQVRAKRNSPSLCP